MPTIRAIRPTDLVSLISFFRRDAHREVTAQVWPELCEGSKGRGRWTRLSRVATRTGGGQAWLSLGEGIVLGLAIANPRAGKLAWDVESLLVARDDRAAGVELLEHLASESARRGARRLFLVTPVDGETARIAHQAGFVNYATETLYSARLPGATGEPDIRRARPRLRQDTPALFQLYNAAVPCRVRSAEAMTVDEWLSLERGSRLWTPSLGGRRQHFVWENGNTVVGWLQVTFGGKSQLMELLVHPSEQSAVEEMLTYSLSQVSSKVPVYFTVRDYQAGLGAALESRGFTRTADYLVFARQLAVRVPGRALVPVRA
ncbi:MAG: N-acetyltransferase family protein [Sphingomonadaceae bacterium]